jgi:hypothetical protein
MPPALPPNTVASDGFVRLRGGQLTLTLGDWALTLPLWVFLLLTVSVLLTLALVCALLCRCVRKRTRERTHSRQVVGGVQAQRASRRAKTRAAEPWNVDTPGWPNQPAMPATLPIYTKPVLSGSYNSSNQLGAGGRRGLGASAPSPRTGKAHESYEAARLLHTTQL